MSAETVQDGFGRAPLLPNTDAAYVIRKAAVLGAGTMGVADRRAPGECRTAGGAAGHSPPGSGRAAPLPRRRSMPSRRASRRRFTTPRWRRGSRVGNFDDDLALLADCDWVIEAVTENLEIKQALLDKVVPAPEARTPF